MQSGALGRQVILELDGSIFGYELLYREHKNSSNALTNDDNYATSNVLLHTSFENIFEELHFDEEFQGALLENDGKLGNLLRLSQNIEKFSDFDMSEFEHIGVGAEALDRALANTYKYVNELRESFKT